MMQRKVRLLLAVILSTIIIGSLSGCSGSVRVDSAPAAYQGRSELLHSVQRGETLERIAALYSLPVEELRLANGTIDPRRLRVGQQLRIPAIGPLNRAERSPFDGHLLPFREATTTNSPLRRVGIRSVRGYIGTLAVPVAGARFSSKFGWRWGRFHEGVDLSAPAGSEIFAAHAGEVVFTSESYWGYGKIVVVRGDNFMTVYGHNRRNRVDRGDWVEKGAWIADVGQTGDASGPHLHFETRVRDGSGRYAAVDPVLFMSRYFEQLGNEQAEDAAPTSEDFQVAEVLQQSPGSRTARAAEDAGVRERATADGAIQEVVRTVQTDQAAEQGVSAGL